MKKLFKRFRFILKIRSFIPFLKDYFLSREISMIQKIFPLLLVGGYILLPIDIIPDFLTFFGILDDVSLLTYLIQRMVAKAPPSLKKKYELN